MPSCVAGGVKRIASMAVLGAMALSACTQATRDQVTRDAAKTAIRPVVAQQFPGVPLDPAIDCIIDNAQSRELLSLAADSVTGATASTTQIVANIASRPETLRCLATDGLSAFLR